MGAWRFLSSSAGASPRRACERSPPRVQHGPVVLRPHHLQQHAGRVLLQRVQLALSFLRLAPPAEQEPALLQAVGRVQRGLRPDQVQPVRPGRQVEDDLPRGLALGAEAQDQRTSGLLSSATPTNELIASLGFSPVTSRTV